jgi:hypothetical protein
MTGAIKGWRKEKQQTYDKNRRKEIAEHISFLNTEIERLQNQLLL